MQVRASVPTFGDGGVSQSTKQSYSRLGTKVRLLRQRLRAHLSDSYWRLIQRSQNSLLTSHLSAKRLPRGYHVGLLTWRLINQLRQLRFQLAVDFFTHFEDLDLQVVYGYGILSSVHTRAMALLQSLDVEAAASGDLLPADTVPRGSRISTHTRLRRLGNNQIRA